MKKKEKEQDENPLHKEFGILGNIRYCFQNIKKYKPILILFIVLGVAMNSFVKRYYALDKADYGTSGGLHSSLGGGFL